MQAAPKCGIIPLMEKGKLRMRSPNTMEEKISELRAESLDVWGGASGGALRAIAAQSLYVGMPSLLLTSNFKLLTFNSKLNQL